VRKQEQFFAEALTFIEKMEEGAALLCHQARPAQLGTRCAAVRSARAAPQIGSKVVSDVTEACHFFVEATAFQLQVQPPCRLHARTPAAA
jgi:hypothetical protein